MWTSFELPFFLINYELQLIVPLNHMKQSEDDQNDGNDQKYMNEVASPWKSTGYTRTEKSEQPQDQ